jgi:hypothetical protein
MTLAACGGPGEQDERIGQRGVPDRSAALLEDLGEGATGRTATTDDSQRGTLNVGSKMPLSGSTQYSPRRRRDLVSDANPIDALPRIVGRQVGPIRGCDDG